MLRPSQVSEQKKESSVMFGTFGFQEMLLIFLLIVVFVGAKKLPQLGAGLGKGIKNFKKSLSEDDDKQIEPGNSDSE